MLEQVSDRLKRQAGGALSRAALACAAAAAGATAAAFLCAAAFVVVLRSYGLTEACLAGAAFFLAIALILLAFHAAEAQRNRRAVAAMRQREDFASAFADPRLILAALQVAQAIGLRRVPPLVAVGGAAFALAARPRTQNRGRREGSRRAPPSAI